LARTFTEKMTMMEVEAKWFVEKKVAQMYPRYKPSPMQQRAVCDRLRRYPEAIAEKALLESYVPGKRQFAEKDFFDKLSAMQCAERKRDRTAEAVEIATDDQVRRMMIGQAQAGNPFALDWCDRHRAEIQIPF
jgi:hypothetical protein